MSAEEKVGCRKFSNEERKWGIDERKLIHSFLITKEVCNCIKFKRLDGVYSRINHENERMKRVIIKSI